MDKLKFKNKFTTLDINYLCQILNKKLNFCRLNNIYDLDQKNYLFKFGKEGVRETLFIETGIRVHTIKEEIEKKEKRNNFCTILRKNLNNRRIESIEQVGLERVIKINFGDFYLFIELYAKGNIILTDLNLKIICNQREHKFNDEEIISKNEIYPLHKVAQYYKENFIFNNELVKNYFIKNKENSKFLKMSLMTNKLAPYCHANLVNDLLQKYNIDPNSIYTSEKEDDLVKILKESLEIFNQKIDNYKGFEIINRKKKTLEFSPILVNKNDNYEIKEIEDYDEYFENYFKNNINKKNEENEEDLEKKIWKKFDKIKNDQNRRLEEMKKEIEISFLKGKLIEENLNEVQGIINIINAMIDSGMSSVLKSSIKQSKQQNDELALMIHDIKLVKDLIILKLESNSEEYLININLKENAIINAKNYYETRAKLLIKQKKTEDAAKDAMKKANNNAKKELKVVQRKVKKENRKLRWFEKFHWFISSENFLVISAKDALQNEMLIKKYMGKDDIVLHAQIQGSPFTLIKYNKDNFNNFKVNENVKLNIPPLTIQEAAMSTLCLSKAWKTKVIVPVFYIKSHQVSKKTPTGLYLPTGSFMIYGKKNFINCTRMEMGFGFLFKVPDDKIEIYENERLIKSDIKDLVDDETNLQNKEEKTKEKDIVKELLAKEGITDELTKIDLMQGKGKDKIDKIKEQENIRNAKKEKERIEKEKIYLKTEKKISKTKKLKMKKFLDKYGDDKEEIEMRNQLYGYKEGKELIKLKNKFEWNENNEDEVYKIEGVIQEEKSEIESQISNVNLDKEKEIEEYKKKKEIQEEEEDLEDNLLEHQLIVDNFKNLTFNPKKDENLIEVLPVCAPFSALSKYKYKVKLVNGVTKRGKAFKLIMETFLSMKEITSLERELLKKIIETQVIHQVMGECKVQAAGLLKIKQQFKKKKKNDKKNNN